MIVKKARENENLEIIGVRFYGDVYVKLSSMPDKRRFKDGRFIFQKSNSNIEFILKEFPHAQWEDEAEQAKIDFENSKNSEKINLENKKIELEFKNYPEIFKTKPLNHQFKSFEISKDLKFYGLFFEQGCGKTKVIIDTASYLFLNKKIESMVVVAPNGVHENWLTDEMPKHCNIQYEQFLWNGSFSKQILRNIDKMLEPSDKLKIWCFNVECFVGEKQKSLLIKILKRNKTMLVVDESQTIKNHQAKRTKFFESISDLATYRRIMTGTPITNGIENIYSQLNFLSSSIIGISSFYNFKAKYCSTTEMSMGGNKKFQKIIGYKSIDDLQTKIQAHTYRVLKKECLDLPEKIYQKESYDLTKEQRRHYDEIKKEGITYIQMCKDNNLPITFDNILVKMKKMQQISLGYMLNIEEKSIIEIVKPEENPRLLKLKELLEKIDGKVIIWTIYTQDIIYISKMLGDKAVRYDGKIAEEQKQANKKMFKENQNIKYLIANTQSMARGHTLTEAETSIYYCNSFDLELRLQSEDRNHRQGTKNNVLYIDIQANKTLDSRIISALRHKKKIADYALQDPENLFMEN
jgi:hypothetical protein